MLLLLLAHAAAAQVPNQEYRGVTDTGLRLRQLATTARVLVIGAHPDDEDNQLLAYLSLKEGATVSYLSLTRGEGGQNSIGSELGPALGVLRTAELLAAREVDRSEQYFTRAYDFGFSKTAEETFEHWPRDSILSDVVAVVRRVRPDVIVAIFSGTARDGHGHHQAAGMLAREAFTAAADRTKFPQQISAGLPAHTAAKLIQATGYRQADPTQMLPTGIYDPLFGHSYAQLAAISRSRHRSQDMGQAQPLGPRSTSIRVLQSATADSTILGGIPVTLSERARAARETPDVQRSLARFDSAIAHAQRSLSPYGNDSVTHILTGARDALSNALAVATNEHVRFLVTQELELLDETLLRLHGIVIDATAGTALLIPGSTAELDVTVWNAGRAAIDVVRVDPLLPDGWTADSDPGALRLPADSVATRKFRVQVPAAAAISQPYFLQRPQTADYYVWPSVSDTAGLAFQHPSLRGRVVVEVDGREIAHTVAATRRVVDPRSGESRRAIHVAPAFSVRPEPATAVTSLSALSGAKRSIDVSVEVINNGSAATVRVTPALPAGWRATPQTAAVTLQGAGDAARARFAIEPPQRVAAGQYEIRFSAAAADGRASSVAQRVVDYPHIENRILFEPAVQRVVIMDAKFARGLRVGYVVGVDPQIPQTLEQLGILVERLGEAQLAGSQLGIYDAIVIGSRAYEVRPDLIAYNARLLDYARNGGNLITLYQQYEFIQGGYAPFALTLARPHTRITDEEATVVLLDTAARALRAPNRIGAHDFAGWVQERALYMPNTWAPEYRPLLEMSDPAEAPQRGALLVAPLGRGSYTYTGLAFLRQIPAGVPGALRLFINLLSMGIKDVTF